MKTIIPQSARCQAKLNLTKNMGIISKGLITLFSLTCITKGIEEMLGAFLTIITVGVAAMNPAAAVIAGAIVLGISGGTNKSGGTKK